MNIVGDNIDTAMAIARECGILTEGLGRLALVVSHATLTHLLSFV